MLRFACPNCGATFKTDERNAGSKGACHHCGQRLRVPPPPQNKTRLGVPLPEQSSSDPAKVERDWHDDSPPVRHSSPTPLTPEPAAEAPGLRWVFWLVAGVLAGLLLVVLALVLAYGAFVMWVVKWFRG